MHINLDEFNIKNNKIIVSVSTGVDSMVLVDLLIKSNFNIVIVHFNHNVREQSIKEYEFIKDFCSLNNIPFEYKSIHISSEENFQNKARTLRYEFLNAMAKKHKTTFIATGHHRDDSVENLISHISKGKNILNLSPIGSIIMQDNTILRPLILFSKNDIYNYAKDNKLTYYEDISNNDNKYTRNNIRNVIVPSLIESFPNFRNNLINISNEVAELKDYFDSLLLPFINDNEILLDEYLNLKPILRKHLLSLLLKEQASKGIINELLESIKDTKHKKFILKDVTIYVEYNKIYFSYNISSNTSDKELVISNPGEFLFNGFKITIKKALDPKTCYNNFKLPLIVRNWNNGDYIELPFGRKKLSRIFIDKKIPTTLRDKKVIITEPDGNILYIHELYKSTREYHGSYHMIIEGDKDA